MNPTAALTAGHPVPAAAPYVTPHLRAPRILAFTIATLIHAFILFAIKSPHRIQITAPTTDPLPKEISIPIEKPEPPPEADTLDRLPRTDAVVPMGLERIEIARPDLPSQPPVEVAPPTRFDSTVTAIPPGLLGNDKGTGSGPIIFTQSSLDRVAQALTQSPPAFPAHLKATVDTAEVRVGFVVQADGKVTQVRIISATHPGFEESIERAAARWRFKPGWKNNRAVPSRMEQTIVFRNER